jgi:hypothetical protein
LGGFAFGYPQGIRVAYIYFYLIFEIKIMNLSRNLWKTPLGCGLSYFLSLNSLFAHPFLIC